MIKNFNKVKMEATNGEEHINNKGLIYKTYKSGPQVNNERTKHPTEK